MYVQEIFMHIQQTFMYIQEIFMHIQELYRSYAINMLLLWKVIFHIQESLFHIQVNTFVCLVIILETWRLFRIWFVKFRLQSAKYARKQKSGSDVIRLTLSPVLDPRRKRDK